METRIDAAAQWITEDEVPTLVWRGRTTLPAECAEHELGFGEEFDLVGATISEAPPARAE